MSARRYLAVVQDPRGYPSPRESVTAEDAPPLPVLHEVVKVDEYERVVAERDRAIEAYHGVAHTGPLAECPTCAAIRSCNG